ncbi:octopamine receptor 1-like [Pollicipes pollicipes]|uniref:octopamine receptor 1-like n=1 Tax=Pollicipes pollicipes TaxID=41117 RepID=UPI001884E0EC|nr:octopamine receptor 1-like [Pollicipes pollicipes]
MEADSSPTPFAPSDGNSSLPPTIDSTVHKYSPAFVIVMSALMLLFMAASLLGNMLVILTVCRNRQMRTRTNLFLVNLAVADVMVAALDMPVALVTLIEGRWVFGEALCQINAFAVGLGTMLSIHTLMHISIHKYISMTRPFSRFMTRQKIVGLIAAAWLWSILYNLTPQLGLTHTVYKKGTTQCGPEIPLNVKQKLHSAINSLVNFYLPLAVMIFCYARIFQEIRAHLGRMRENSNMAERSSVLQQQRIAVTLFLVLACFLLCIAPYIVYSNGLVMARDKDAVPLILNPIAYWCVYLNSALNPVIYGARSSSFRQSYKDILLGTKRMKISTLGSMRSVGSTRLYSHRVSLPANSPFRQMSGFLTPAPAQLSR